MTVSGAPYNNGVSKLKWSSYQLYRPNNPVHQLLGSYSLPGGKRYYGNTAENAVQFRSGNYDHVTGDYAVPSENAQGMEPFSLNGVYKGDGFTVTNPTCFTMTRSVFLGPSNWRNQLTSGPGRYEIYGRNSDTDTWTTLFAKTKISTMVTADGVKRLKNPYYEDNEIDMGDNCYFQYGFVVSRLYGKLDDAVGEGVPHQLSFKKWLMYGQFRRPAMPLWRWQLPSSSYTAVPGFNAVNPVKSLWIPAGGVMVYPTLATTYTVCRSMRMQHKTTRTDIDWSVTCYTNGRTDESAYVSDQTDIGDSTAVSPYEFNPDYDIYLHSTYTWDSALSNAEMKIATAGFRRELGGVPYSETTPVIPIIDVRAYNLRLLLALRQPSVMNIFSDFDGSSVPDRGKTGTHSVTLTGGVGALIKSTGQMLKITEALRAQLGGVNEFETTPVVPMSASDTAFCLKCPEGFGVDKKTGDCLNCPDGMFTTDWSECGTNVIKSASATVFLAIAPDDFTEDMQKKYIAAVAIVVGVRREQVKIVRIGPRNQRRLLQDGGGDGTDVETEVQSEEGSSLMSVEESMTSENMNAYSTSSPSSGLPPMNVGTLTLVTALEVGAVINFEGASSYAEAAIAVEFDAITYMAYPYAASYTYRIDNMLILNFLGQSNTHYTRIRDMIADGSGFNTSKQDGDEHHNLTPDFGEDILCSEVGDTTGIDTGHMQCFWRRVIVANEVQPVARESVYFYRNENADDKVNAKAWITDTILGGNSGFSTATASDYFDRICSRSNDPQSEPRSYGCLFVDQGYRWRSRLRGPGASSPFSISGKTIVVAVVTISDENGVVIRRRLLSTDSNGTKEVDIPDVKTDAENSRHLLQETKAERVTDTVGNNAIAVTSPAFNPDLNFMFITGNQNNRAQILKIETSLNDDVPLTIFAGVTKKLMLATGSAGHLGPLVQSLQPFGFESEPTVVTANRRLLQDDAPGSIINVSAVVRTLNSFGNVYVNVLACGMETMANKTELLDDPEVGQIISGCVHDITSTGMRGSVMMSLSTCTVDMAIMDVVGCNILRGFLGSLPAQPEVEWGSADTKTAALYFQIDFDAPYGIFRDDTTLSAHVRATVAEVLQVATDRVHVVFYARNSPVTQARRLLQNTDDKATADVWIYKDTRAIYKDVGFNKIPAEEVLSWFRKSSGWREQIESLLEAIPEMQVKSISDGITTGIKEPRENASASGMDPGYIVAIVFVCLLVLVVVFLGVSLCMKMRKAKSQETSGDEGTLLLRSPDFESPNGIGDTRTAKSTMLFANTKIRVKK
ncbi:hypothetical protein T484DRAFT_1756448 [Baffinella frigidus]|nr:hypothetical protein T484DRAFT_1756448 [Cryptophyta sp. CCMP2293]